MPGARSLALAAASSFLLGAILLSPDAGAEVRRQTPPQAFSSGAMRSEQVLLDIKALLQRIDSRMASIERDVADLKHRAATRPGTVGLRSNHGGVRVAD